MATTGVFAQVKVGSNPTNPAANSSFQVEGTDTAKQFVILKTGNIGVGTKTPAAALDIKSTNSGIMIPKYTTAARTALTLTLTAAQDGLIVYDTDEDCIFTYKHGSPGTWVSYCKTPFSIYAISNLFTTLGQKGAKYTANSTNVLNPPLTWTVESFSGDISNVSIAANSPTTTATVTYDVPATKTNNGYALVRLKAVDASGQIQYTSTNLITSFVISETPLACNGNLQTNNPTLVNTKLNLFAKTSSSDAYITYIAPSNSGNVNVAVTGDTVSALVDPGTGNILKTWKGTSAGGTGVVTVRPPVFTSNSSDFNNNPTLNFTAAKKNALGIVTGNGSGAFKLVFLAKAAGGQNATIVSAIPSSNLGAGGAALNGSWQISRRDTNNYFVFRSFDSFTSYNSQTVNCPQCGNSEVAFSKWSDFADGKPHLVVVDYDGSKLKGYFDGAKVFEITPNASFPPTGNQFRLGANRLGTQFIDMELSELIIGKSTMTTAELITVQGYFLCKYGLDASLLAYASPFSIDNDFYNNPSQFSLQIDGTGKETVYDKINNIYYNKANVPTPGLGYFTSPQISAIQADYIISVAPGPGANQITCTRGNGTTFTITVP